MSLIHPLHLVEIQELIARHLDTDSLLACLLVCKAWSVSFRPALWNIVVASSTGPDLFSPQNQPLLRHIRHLEYRIHPPESRLPTLGFTYLTSLKICPLRLGGDLTDVHLLWAPMTEILRTLSTGPFSTLELCSDTATEAFWNALASCTSLHTLILKNLTITSSVFMPFWRACHKVETLVLHNTTACANNHATLPWLRRTRLGRLRHIVLKDDSALRWSYALSLPWLRAPYLETVRCYSSGVELADVRRLDKEIGACIIARLEGRVFYYDRGLAQGQLYLDADGDEDPVETEQLRYLVPGKRIREFRCVLSRLGDPDYLARVISNMDTLEKFAVREVKHATRSLSTLSLHVETLVELDIWGSDLDQEALVTFLEKCPRLEVFVANSIDAEVVVKSRPWVCAGLRVLRVAFHAAQNSLYANMTEIDEKQEQVLVRLAGLSLLEGFHMPEYWYRCGLGRLRGLVHVQDVFMLLTLANDLKAADAKWMVEHWPMLKRVRVSSFDISVCIPVDVARVFEDRGIECVSLKDGKCP
ncbi:hypothetical protein BG003_004790 [Podila horticola]|nr:hypothetical protein BG003_004790 [Podila horticola]